MPKNVAWDSIGLVTRLEHGEAWADEAMHFRPRLLSVVFLAIVVATPIGCKQKPNSEDSGADSLPVVETIGTSPAATPTAAGNSVTSMDSFVIESRKPFVVTSGLTVELFGKGFNRTLVLAVNDVSIPVLVASDVNASFVVPQGFAAGALNLTVEQDGVIQKVSLIYSPDPEIPIFTKAPEKICAPEKYYDGDGILRIGTRDCSALDLVNCTADGQVGCIAVAAYKAANMVNATAGNIKSGVTIAGVAGAFPSGTYPLTGADVTADLDLGTFDAKIKSSASFEWFGPSGTRYTTSGAANITAANIASGVTIFGTSGTLTGGSNCMGDGQMGCLTTSRYKSMDTDATVISVWDIRSGKTAGGIAGSIIFHKNMANTALFDRTTGAGSMSGLDIYDTIDDFNQDGLFPTQNNVGWAQATGANWARDAVSDNGAGGGTASTGACEGTEHCVYKDQLTGLFLGKIRSRGEHLGRSDHLL